MATLRLEIVTPEAKAFSEDVDMVTLPGSEGELGILPQHIPLLTAIKPGALRVQQQGQETFFAVGEGFVEVTQESVIVLTDMALKDTQIDEAAAETEIKAAEAELKTQHLNDEELATVEASLEKSLAKLNVKRRLHR